MLPERKLVNLLDLHWIPQKGSHIVRLPEMVKLFDLSSREFRWVSSSSVNKVKLLTFR